jgi:triosephosphate isomerase
MLKAQGVSFAIVGHSERRAQGETDELVRAQLAAALAAGLTAILCVGETEREPDGSHWAQVANQIHRALHGITPVAGRLIVAYEPVWAIGKSAAEAMRGEELEETAIFVRKIVSEALGREAMARVPILYGGSVEPENAGALIREGGINGFLVGHASADIDSFIEILKACKK